MDKIKRLKYRVGFIYVFIFSGNILNAQMLDPSMDYPGEPFCYFSQPTDVIGVMDGREGTLVTPEGYLYTGFAELMFFTDNPPVPVRNRIKTLYKGYLPVVQYQVIRQGIDYRFMLYAATLDGNPESPLINFIRVNINNMSGQKRTVHFAVGIRYQNDANTDWGVGDNRFGRPATGKILGEYEQSGVEFSQDWVYGFKEDALIRDGRIVYFYPSSPTPERMLTLKMGYNEAPNVQPMSLFVLPTTPVGTVKYSISLNPGEERVLEFKMPYEPYSEDHPHLDILRSADFDTYLNRTEEFWEHIFSRGIDVYVPEEKVVNTFKANLVFPLIARDKIEDQYIQKVNEFQYDAFWLRDASYIVRMYDISGYHDYARQCLDFFQSWQRPDGNFVSQGGQYDGWGQTLWAYGQHYRITRDRLFADNVFPSVNRAISWFTQVRQNDIYQLMPVTTPGDNENITGHVTGHNFWALAGLKNAITLAEGLGKDESANEFLQEYNELFSALNERLNQLCAETEGYIPPGLDTLGGQDWGNMLSVYPEMILDPFHPWVEATLNVTRSKYQEGLMTYGYGRFLHHYLTMKNTETHVIRGDQKTALEEFYAVLLHTSATHAGFEFSILPWGTRDFGMNLTPHGWFAATFRTLLRNMLVREQEKELHLLSCISPGWIKTGESIEVSRAPTYFGEINFRLSCDHEGATLFMDHHFHHPPVKLVVHLPWFMNVKEISIDNHCIDFYESTVTLPVGIEKVDIKWEKSNLLQPMSYKDAVENYKTEYRRRYEEFLIRGN